MAFSRLYETALHGPLAEQLADAAGIGSGMRVLEVGAGLGVLTRRLASAVGLDGSVVAVESSKAAGRALREELLGARVAASVVVAPGDALPFAAGEFGVAVSLFGVTSHRGGVSALREMERVAATVAVITRGASPPAPEALLARAWQDVAGFIPPLARPAPAPPSLPGWTSTPLHDVVRFDSASLLWDAITAGPRGRAPDFVVQSVRESFRESVAPFEGADGTLRIPVEVALLRRG